MLAGSQLGKTRQAGQEGPFGSKIAAVSADGGYSEVVEFFVGAPPPAFPSLIEVSARPLSDTSFAVAWSSFDLTVDGTLEVGTSLDQTQVGRAKSARNGGMTGPQPCCRTPGKSPVLPRRLRPAAPGKSVRRTARLARGLGVQIGTLNCGGIA